MKITNSTGKGITVNPKLLSQWTAIIVIVVGSIVDSALTRDQVRRNTGQLEANPLAVFATEQKNMAEDVKEIKEDVKDLTKTVSDYMLTH